MKKLSDLQRSALGVLGRGPLFRNSRGAWSHAKLGRCPFPDRTIRRLLSDGLVEQLRTAQGVPFVRLTRAGCAVIDVGYRPRPYERGETAVQAAAALHERIAP